jgi:cytochrome c-type biogenesis protein CcmH/NrfF
VTRAPGLAIVLLYALAFVASATKMDAGDNALDLRIKKLEAELRCLVCQNQTLADSNAELAGDLRRAGARGLAEAGKTDREIKAYLVARPAATSSTLQPTGQDDDMAAVGWTVCALLGGWHFLMVGRLAGTAAVVTAVATPLSDSGAEARARKLLEQPEPPPAC